MNEDTDQAGTTNHAYSIVIDFIHGWHCLVANLSRSIGAANDVDSVEKEITKFQAKQNKHLKKFKTDFPKALGIALVNDCFPVKGENEGEDEPADDKAKLDDGKTNKKLIMKTIGTHIHVWKTDIAHFLDAERDDDGVIQDLNAFKETISKQPSIFEDMIGEFRGDIYSLF